MPTTRRHRTRNRNQTQKPRQRQKISQGSKKPSSKQDKRHEDTSGKNGRDAVQDEEDVPQDEEDVPQDEEDVSQDEEDVSQDEEDVSQDEEDVSQDEEDVSQDEEDVSQDEEDVSQDEEDVSQDEEDVSQDEEEAVVQRVHIQAPCYSELTPEQRQVVLPYNPIPIASNMLSIEQIPKVYNSILFGRRPDYKFPAIGMVIAASLNHLTYINDIPGRFKYAHWSSSSSYGVLVFASKRFSQGSKEKWQSLLTADRILSTQISSPFHWKEPATNTISIQFLRGRLYSSDTLVLLDSVISKDDFEYRNGYALIEINNNLFFGLFKDILTQDGPWSIQSETQRRYSNNIVARFALPSKSDAARQWFKRWRLPSPTSMIDLLQQSLCHDIGVRRWSDIYDQLLSDHDPIDSNFCILCQKPMPSNYHRHISEIHLADYRPFSCTFEGCRKAYSQKQHMKMHALTHAPPQFTCTFEGCKKAFSRKSHLKSHALTHDSARSRITCTFEGCGKKFTHNSSMTRHALTHDPASPQFTCTFEGCGRAFSRGDQMKRHTLTHTQPQLTCKFEGCGKTFTQKSDMTTHALTHDPASPRFICTFGGCGKTFTRKDNMERHAKTHDQ